MDDTSTIQDLGDLALQMTLNDLSYNAMKDNSSFTPKPIKTATTKEMIQEYLNEQNQPIIINGRQYAYHPSQLKPELEEIDESKIEPILSLEEKTSNDELVQELAGHIKAYEQNIKDNYDDIQEAKRIINEEAMFIGEDDPYIYNSPDGYSYKFKSINDVRKFIQDCYKMIEQNKEEIQNLDAGLLYALQTNERNKEYEDNNRAEIERVQQINKIKLNKWTEDLNLLNRGSLNVSKNDFETDEEYMQRLENLEMTKYDDTLIEAQAKLANIKKVKELIKPFLNKEFLIEQVLREYNSDDLQTLKKYRELIFKKLKTKYGLKNKDVIVEDIINDFNLYLDDIRNKRELIIIKSPDQIERDEIHNEELLKTDNIEQEIEGQLLDEEKLNKLDEGTSEEKQEKQELSENISVEPTDNNSIKISNTETDTYVYIKLGKDKKKKHLLISYTDDDTGKYIQLDNRGSSGEYGLETLKENLNLNSNDIRLIFGKVLKNNEMYDYMETIFQLDGVKEKRLYKLTQSGKKSIQQEYMGWGIEKPDIPDEVKIGDHKLLLKKLINFNIFSIKNKHNKNVKGLLSIPVSKHFKNIILSLVKSENISNNDLSLLTDDEKELLTVLINATRTRETIGGKLPLNDDKIINKLKDRLKLIEGEMQSGNNNKELYNELYQIIQKLVHFNVLKKYRVEKYLSDVKRTYFK